MPVLATADGEFEDLEAPKLAAFSLSPTEVDVSEKDQQVKVVAEITDNLSGVWYAGVAIASPDGKQGQSTTLQRVGGTDTDAIFEGTLTIPRFSATGKWKIGEVSLRDNANNYRPIGPAQLTEAGFPASIQVDGVEESEDTEVPVPTGVSVEPKTIDVSNSARTVTLEVKATDDLSGLSEESYAAFLSPSNKEKIIGGPFKLVAGTAANGTFRSTFAFPKGSETGEWRLLYLHLFDNAGHNHAYEEGELAEMGLGTKLTVKAEEPEDTGSPQLFDLTIEPDEINTSVSKQPVSVVMDLVDESGLSEAAVFFESPSGESSAFGGGPKLVSGSPTNGSFEVVVTFPAGSEAGEWKISSIVLVDKVGNKVTLPRGEIEGAGMPVTVTVVGQPPVVSGISPGSGPEAGGTEVKISGSGFAGATEVRFGSKSVPFEIASAGSLVAIAPPGIGTVGVSVTTPGGISEPGPGAQFTYRPPVSLSSSPNPSVHGQKVTFTAKVEPEAPGAPTPLGTVAFVDGTNTLGVANLSKGVATLSLSSLGAGKHAVVAQYSGDSTFGSGSSKAVEQVVAKASTEVVIASTLNPAPFGTTATLKATVKALAPGAGTPAGTVTFREGETVLGTVQLAGASATYPLKSLPAGEHVISATYSGDANNGPDESNELIQVIVKATTTTNLVSALNPAPYGSSRTLKATVKAVPSGGGTPTGTVTFREGETVLETVPLEAGVAKYAFKALPTGEHAITATYDGDADYATSADEVTQAIVKASTTVTLTSTSNPAPNGSTGSLKATVKAVAPGTGTPTGTVTFREGETVLATVPLASGAAKYFFKPLPPGSHEIVATFGGAANYEPSEGSITQVISP